VADISNPHDRFFKETFSQPEIAADFLANHLPAPVAAVLDLDPAALELVRGSFVDRALRPHFSDLLYRVRLQDGQPVFVYLLFEHKSFADPWVAFQLLRYMVRIWEQSRRRDPQAPLVPIIPIVVYSRAGEVANRAQLRGAVHRAGDTAGVLAGLCVPAHRPIIARRN
jgi:predicted transposase/invertase (TIGR01784 family)